MNIELCKLYRKYRVKAKVRSDYENSNILEYNAMYHNLWIGKIVFYVSKLPISGSDSNVDSDSKNQRQDGQDPWLYWLYSDYNQNLLYHFFTFRNPHDLHTMCRNRIAPEKGGIRELLLLTHPDPSLRLPELKLAPSVGKLSI